MTPADATNLLLAIMYDDELSVAEQSVARLREATFARCRHQKFGETEPKFDDFPENGFFRSEKDRPLAFGEVIETMLQWWTDYGSVEEGCEHDLNLSVVNLTLTVSSPGYAATIRFNTHEGFWEIQYDWKPPEQIAYELGVRGDPFATRWDALHAPYMWSERTVSEDSLYAIAECLAGRPLEHGESDIIAPDTAVAAPEPQEQSQ